MYSEHEIDKLMADGAETANRSVDFGALRDRIELERKRRAKRKRTVARLTGIAAAFVVFIGVGAFAMSGLWGASIDREESPKVADGYTAAPIDQGDAQRLDPERLDASEDDIEGMYSAYKGGSSSQSPSDLQPAARSSLITTYLRKIEAFDEELSEIVVIGAGGDFAKKGVVPELVIPDQWSTTQIDITRKYAIAELNEDNYYMAALCAGVESVQLNVGECMIEVRESGMVRALWRVDAERLMYVECKGLTRDDVLSGLKSLNYTDAM
ncbi:MAG: hypothetical protein Q4B99_02150 [Clostridia bacterium]|nr:hypothetical protein [Clostridia bacterium]